MSRGTLKKALVIAFIVGAVAVFKVFHLDEYLTLSYLKESRQEFEVLYAAHRFSVLAIYMAAYVLVAALSLPGAVILTIAAGALFGLVTGTIAVSFSSTIGATIACFISRFVLHDWVQARFGERLKAVNESIKREGIFYLFTLRLIPVFPFWLINLVMGLTKMPLRTFSWVSQVGMLPGTIVYVNAGGELVKIESLSGILSPGLIFSLVLLGLFPIAARRIVAFYRARGRMKGGRFGKA